MVPKVIIINKRQDVSICFHIPLQALPFPNDNICSHTNSACRQSVDKLFTEIKTGEDFELVQFLVCQEMTDSDNCTKKATEWGPYLAQIIYSDQASKYVCEILDPICNFE